MFKKILIANRGEIALRIIRTCKEMGISTVAVYSEADRESLHVRFADEAVCIGPPPSHLSYLNIPNIMSAADITNADAIHPGYGFLSENIEFAKVCQESNIKFIGATADMITDMGDKANAKTNMKNAGVPVIPGSDGLVDSIKEAKKIAKKIKYPIILKATAGGGGRGMRLCWTEKEIDTAWYDAKQESNIAFGNDGIYIEKYIEEPRHVEFQIIGDAYGKACHLSERDCSIQRRHQKLVEETPSPIVNSNLRKEMGEAAVRAGESIGYEGVGTVEFLVDKHENFYFMEMNTRIQVEHPITECVTNFDLVKEQIKVAASIPIKGINYFPSMFSMECRINAEDPAQGFRPSPGKIKSLSLPGGIGIRVDSHIYEGYTIPPYYDSMIAKLIVTANSRAEVINRMQRGLEEFVIEGIKTTIPFHLKLMQDPKFISGKFDTSFLNHFDFSNL